MNDVLDDDAALVARLRAGDESAFARAFEDHHPLLYRLALAYVRTTSAAEEVVQDTWLAVLDALDRFEGRARFKTWIARIAINKAKTRAAREARTVPLSIDDELGADEPAVDASRFRSFGLWKELPDAWRETPESLAQRREIRDAIEAGLEALPPVQRSVVTLRDLEGWSAEEVCNVLELSESNQRVLLHRGRARLRALLEPLLKEGRRR